MKGSDGKPLRQDKTKQALLEYGKTQKYYSHTQSPPPDYSFKFISAVINLLLRKKH